MAKKQEEKQEPVIRYIMKDGSVLHTLDELEEYAQKITLPDYIVRQITKMCIPD